VTHKQRQTGEKQAGERERERGGEGDLVEGSNEERLSALEREFEDGLHGGLHEREIEMLPTERTNQSQQSSADVEDVVFEARRAHHQDRLRTTVRERETEAKASKGKVEEGLTSSIMRALTKKRRFGSPRMRRE
jgi:hypothetical protein